MNLLLCDVLVSGGKINLALPADGLTGDVCSSFGVTLLDCWPDKIWLIITFAIHTKKCVSVLVPWDYHLLTTEDSQGNLSLLIIVSIKMWKEDHSFLMFTCNTNCQVGMAIFE